MNPRLVHVWLIMAAAALSLSCSLKLNFDKFTPGGGSFDSWFPDSSKVDGGPTPDIYQAPDSKLSGCNPMSFTLKQAPAAEVYLVVDRSGSMAEKSTGSKVTKWVEMYSAVQAALKQFQGTLRLGLLMYPVDKQCAVAGPQVTIGFSKVNAILYHLNKAVPLGGTPTGAAISNAAQSLKDLGSKSTRKYLILATDGGPNCNYLISAASGCQCTLPDKKYCCTSYTQTCYSGHTCLDQTNTLKVISDLHSLEKISTFVIGLDGTDEYKSLLNEMAKSGGVPLTGGTASYYSASDLEGLKSALKTIVGSVISCEIQLESVPKQPDQVLIFLDGQKVVRDKTKKNGWDYSDSTLKKIKLFGKACELLQVGKKHKLTATFACDVN